MKRRDFFKRSGILLGAATFAGNFQNVFAAGLVKKDDSRNLRVEINDYFLKIFDGFLRNAVKTSDSFAVCDFPGGTKLKNCLAVSGKTYVSVARMMPALAAWHVAGNSPKEFRENGVNYSIENILLAAFRNGFNPNHADFWGYAPPNKATQHAVEASPVASTLQLLGDDFLAKLTADERANIQKWLASCTQVAERDNNHAWFSAINQAARLKLSAKWKEFSGSEEWMLADLQAIDALYKNASDGVYSDSPQFSTYDYYNFWTFTSHYLYWRRIIGEKYPDWTKKFDERAVKFLGVAPYFFGANGAHVLFGRSLIYRWGVLMPLVEAHAQNLGGISPGGLRSLVRRSLKFHFDAGAFDEKNGKLLETFTPSGSRAIAESYVDNGHPYWCMQSFSLYQIPPKDVFWTGKDAPLPIDEQDFSVKLESPQMILSGTKSSGQVRMIHAVNTPRRPYYRDNYYKFSYSTHFPFNAATDKMHAPWDEMLVIRDLQTKESAGRGGFVSGKLTANGAENVWWIELGGKRYQFVSKIEVFGEFERRTHRLTAPAESVGKVEILEGSAALGLAESGNFRTEKDAKSRILISKENGYAIGSWNVAGFDSLETTEQFAPELPENINIIYPKMAVNTLQAHLKTAEQTFVSLHYASPKPLKNIKLRETADNLMSGR